MVWFAPSAMRGLSTLLRGMEIEIRYVTVCFHVVFWILSAIASADVQSCVSDECNSI